MVLWFPAPVFDLKSFDLPLKRLVMQVLQSEKLVDETDVVGPVRELRIERCKDYRWGNDRQIQG